MSAVGNAYRRAKRRVPPHVRRRVPPSVRTALGAISSSPWRGDPLGRLPPPDRLSTAEVTRAVFSRLTLDEVDELVDRLPAAQRRLVADAEPHERQRLIVSLGVHEGRPAFAEKVGYGPPEPPPGVPAAARGPLAVAGAYALADTVVDALRFTGVRPWFASPALDFGCGSGRVVRALASVYPHVEWHACDPDERAIAWARDAERRVEFARTPPRPPLPYADESFDYAYAMSAWARLDPDAARAWLAEMQRVIRPGGYLILAVNGPHALARHGAKLGRRRHGLWRAAAELGGRGFWFAPDEGRDGEGGTAFISAEWLARQMRGRWEVVSYAAARGENSRDVVILRRVPRLPFADARHRELRTPEDTDHEVSDALHSRLDPSDMAAIEAAMGPEHRRLYDRATPGERKAISLALGLHHGVGDVARKTGLSAVEPPEDVHAMARGPLATGGGYWYADLVVRALRAAGGDPRSCRRALDFGASSGRVLRPLQIVYPEVEWHGCDPNSGAIEWAREHLAPIRFEVSPQHPPLPYDDASFDFVYAISIWSHFGERAAVAWLEEMRRVIRPGGLLLLTTHGYGSLAYYAHIGERSRLQLGEIDRALYRSGFWYEPEFGEEGDWGVKDPEWGTSYLAAEWLLERCLPQWEPAYFGAGEVASNQDLYVLRRR